MVEKYREKFPEVKTFTVDEMFGGWAKAHQAHFASGGTFDTVMSARRK
jgi:sulfate transport system substrate-binding protein